MYTLPLVHCFFCSLYTHVPPHKYRRVCTFGTLLFAACIPTYRHTSIDMYTLPLVHCHVQPHKYRHVYITFGTLLFCSLYTHVPPHKYRRVCITFGTLPFCSLYTYVPQHKYRHVYITFGTLPLFSLYTHVPPYKYRHVYITSRKDRHVYITFGTLPLCSMYIYQRTATQVQTCIHYLWYTASLQPVYLRRVSQSMQFICSRVRFVEVFDRF